MDSTAPDFTFILRSDTRREALVALDKQSPLDRPEIADQVDASRRTVSRTLNTLVEEGYVQSQGGVYRLTALGDFVAGLYQDWRDQLTLAKRYRPFLANVGSDFHNFEYRSLRGANLTVATEINPYAAMDRFLSIRDGATQVRAVTPMTEKQCLTQTARRLRKGETFELEVIVAQGVLDHARPRTKDESALEEIRAAESISRFVYPGSIETMISIVDDVAVFGAYTDRELHALLESDAPELREHATDRIDEYRRNATPVAEFRE